MVPTALLASATQVSAMMALEGMVHAHSVNKDFMVTIVNWPVDASMVFVLLLMGHV